MSNPFHIDLLLNYPGTSGDITTEPINVKTGANGLFLKAVLDTAEIKIQHRPKGGTGWYEKPAGTFVAADLDGSGQAWDNTNLSEGEVRAVLTGATATTVITEFMLRPVHETEVQL